MDLHFFNQLILAFLLLVPIVLIARTVVAGTRYSPILIIVVFGLIMGALMVCSQVATEGLPEFPVVLLLSQVTIVALIASFFVGGQELRKILVKKHLDIEELVSPSQEEVVLGTKRTQLFFIIRSVFILTGVFSFYKLAAGHGEGDVLGKSYILLAYLGLVFSIILVDSKASIKNKPAYIRKGVVEFLMLLLIMLVSLYCSQRIKPLIGLPQIFFAMIIASGLGFILARWQFGPTIRALLFAGIPVVLAANFLVGGSRLIQAFSLHEMKAVMSYGFFGQVFWMFGGIALLAFMQNHVRNLAPGMAGSLSHSGLTGACTAGDLGQEAAARAPIMINVPFIGHLFVFSILAHSAKMQKFAFPLIALVLVTGLVLTALSLRGLKRSAGEEAGEVKSLMLFSFGWQLVAVFGSFLLLGLSGMSINNAAMATSSALSHFGLFAATQGGMFGENASVMIPFIFAMPFLVHPVVFGMFGRAMTNDGIMPRKTAVVLAILGLAGVVFSLLLQMHSTIPNIDDHNDHKENSGSGVAEHAPFGYTDTLSDR